MKVTYYLGAGASYNAIPIVGELDKAFENLNTQSSELLKDFENLGLSAAFKIFQAHMQTGANASKIFGTIDTYAKHLWLTSDLDLKALKESLSFFFTVWQEIDKNHFNGVEIRNKPFEDIDRRYLGLFANYLERKNGDIILNEDVEFITWNYDSQIERALSLFTGSNNIERILTKFNVYPFIYGENSYPKVVHLNGIAGLYAASGNETNTFFERTKKEKNIFNVFQESLYTINSKTTSNDKYFTFAWEDDPISQGAIKHAEKILSNTEILVIIGYSFPTFNDLIDKQLMKILKESEKFKMVYFQDPNATKEFLYTRFGIPHEKITVVTKTEQFILPLDSHSLNPFEDEILF
jgi:hypothetical protein